MPTSWWSPYPHYQWPSYEPAPCRLHYAATVALNVGEAALLCQIVPALWLAPLRSAPPAGHAVVRLAISNGCMWLILCFIGYQLPFRQAAMSNTGLLWRVQTCDCATHPQCTASSAGGHSLSYQTTLPGLCATAIFVPPPMQVGLPAAGRHRARVYPAHFNLLQQPSALLSLGRAGSQLRLLARLPPAGHICAGGSEAVLL